MSTLAGLQASQTSLTSAHTAGTLSDADYASGMAALNAAIAVETARRAGNLMLNLNTAAWEDLVAHLQATYPTPAAGQPAIVALVRALVSSKA